MDQATTRHVDTDCFGQLADKQAEHEFQTAKMPFTRRRMRFTCIITALAYLGAIYADSLQISGNDFTLLIAARIFTALTGMMPVILSFLKSTTPGRLGLYTGVYMSVLMGTESLELILKADMLSLHETPITVVIALMYYIFQTPQIWQSIIAGGLGSLAYLLTLVMMTPATPDFISNISLTFALANGFGLYFSITFNKAQRREYAALAELKRKAETDVLTSIYNRRRVMELGQREFNSAKRYGHPCSLLILDIDHFKRINDTHGHAAGDYVLITMVERCAETLREVDILGRIGGEEFAIFMPHSTQEQALKAAERLRRAVEETPFTTGGKDLTVTVSIGVAEVAADMESMDELFRKVDTALYAAKDNGRNGVQAA